MFEASQLSVLVQDKGVAIWDYRHRGAMQDLGADNFFGGAYEVFGLGDLIVARANDQIRGLTVTGVGDRWIGVCLPGMFGFGFGQWPSQQAQESAGDSPSGVGEAA